MSEHLRIFKLPLERRGTWMTLPNCHQVTSVGPDTDGQPSVWFTSSPEAPPVHVAVFWTGDFVPTKSTFVGRYISSGLVNHVFYTR